MQLTIVRDDNTVVVDGERHTVDCSDLPKDFHALQWQTGHGGEIEYAAVRCDHCGVRAKKGNAIISDLVPYQKYIDAWRAVKVTADTLRVERERVRVDAAGPQS